MRRVRAHDLTPHVLGVCVALVSTWSAMRAFADEADVFAIAPGNESLVGSMLGMGAPLPSACELDAAHVERTRIVATYRCGDARPELELAHPSERAEARLLTERFALRWRSAPPAELADEVERRIRRRERDFHWMRVGARRTSDRTHDDASSARAAIPVIRKLELVVACVLLALGVPALAFAFRRTFGTFAGHGDASGRALGVAVVLGIAVRLAVPLTLVTLYIGYLLTEQSIELQLDSHYGLASQIVPHLVLAVFPHDHRTLMRANTLVGMLSIPLVATLAARLGRDRRTGIVAAVLVALVPLFVKNDASEANNVVTVLALFGGLVLFEAFANGESRVDLACATVLLAFAAVSRPEMPLLTPAFVVGVFAFCSLEDRRRVLRDRAAWIAVCVYASLVLPHAVHVVRAGRDLASSAELAAPGAMGTLHAFVRGAVRLNTVLTPSLFPLAIPVLAVVSVALAERRDRIARAVLLGVVVLALGVYGIDLCTANMARVHVPAALFTTLLAAMGAVRLHDAASSTRARAATIVVLAVALVASSIPTAIRLYAPTNEDAEEAFIRAALERLPRRGRFTWVRMGSLDSDVRDPTHRHFPDYLVRPPNRSGRTASIEDFVAEPDFDAPAYFYVGTRCYAHFRPEGVTAPRGTNFQPACAVMRARFRLEPVLERRIVNRRDVWLEYYGDATRLDLGLYRVFPR